MFWLYYIPIIFWSYFDYIIVVFTVPGTITYVTEYLDQNKKILYFSDFSLLFRLSYLSGIITILSRIFPQRAGTQRVCFLN